MDMLRGRGFTIVEIIAALIIVAAAVVVSCLAIPMF